MAITPPVTDDELRAMAEPLKRTGPAPVDHVADALRAVRVAMDAVCGAMRPMSGGDVVVVSKAELKLLRECAKQAKDLAREYEVPIPMKAAFAYATLPLRLLGAFSTMAEVGQQIIDRGVDLGTLSAEEKQLERDRAGCIEWVINFTHALEKYEEAMDGERIRTILPDPITSPGAHDRLVEAIETLSAYGPKLEGE